METIAVSARVASSADTEKTTDDAPLLAAATHENTLGPPPKVDVVQPVGNVVVPAAVPEQVLLLFQDDA